MNFLDFAQVMVLAPVRAEGEDRRCSCIVCHLPRIEEDGVERGEPVEYVIRMRLRDATIWQGLHQECWDRNRQPRGSSSPREASDVFAETTFMKKEEKQ